MVIKQIVHPSTNGVAKVMADSRHLAKTFQQRASLSKGSPAAICL
jgi:hypothetical protein